jgi:LacI family transcriptional regulator
MRKKRITTTDIAKAADVSRTTVSFVLNNKIGQHISEETKHKIIQIAKNLGYIPDKHAVKLAKTSRYKIGLLVDITESYHFSDAFLSVVFESMRRLAKRKRDSLYYLPLNMKRKAYLETVAALQLDAAIVLFPKENSPLAQDLRKIHLPFLILGKMSDSTIVSVDIDNYQAARLATQYLIDEGFEQIAMVAHAPLDHAAAFQRRKGFLDAMQEAKLTILPEWLAETAFTVESGYKAAANLWSLNPKPQAIFAGNDEIALGIMIYLKEHQVKIPEDVSIIGFDDDPMSEYLFPALTTVAVPGNELGKHCMKRIYSLLRGETLKPMRVELPTHIVIRDSVGQVAGK